MDFVISKVAMTICALIVVSVLGGAFGSNGLFRNIDELDSILNDLGTTLERLAWSGCEGEAAWRVPFLSDGSSIDVIVCDSVLSARADRERATLSPECSVHTWVWNGSALNQSSLEILQADAPQVLASSGLSFEIRTQMIAFENQDAIFAFVSTPA